MNRLKLITAPTEEPITLSALKLALQVEVADDDTLLTDLIKAARQACEEYTGLALVTQTWDLSRDEPGNGDYLSTEWWDGVRDASISELSGSTREIEIPIGPLQSITSITAYDEADVGVVFASSNYYVDTATEPGRVVLRDGKSWPIVLRVANGFVVRFVAGYGAAAAVPEPIKRGMIEWARHYYEGCADESSIEVAKRLWRSYRRVII